MVIKNPNDFQLLGAYIKFQSLTSNQLDPTKYMQPYDGAINGVTTDCSTLFNPNSDSSDPNPPAPSPNAPGLQAGQSCAYKFEARWGYNSNIDAQQTEFPFKMYYSFWNPYSITNGQVNYVFNNTCTQVGNYFCLPDNQNLQFKQRFETPLKDRDINYQLVGMYNLVTSKNISMDGNYAWAIDRSGPSASLFRVNYDNNTNSTNLQLESSYSGNWFSNTDSSVLSYDGMNWFRNIYYQQGLIGLNVLFNPIQWVYGLDNNIYGNNYNVNSDLVVILNQNKADITQSNVTNIVNLGAVPTTSLVGVSAKSNILVSQVSGGFTTYYCYFAKDGYTNPKTYLGSLYLGDIIVTPNSYYYKDYNYYKSINNDANAYPRGYSYYKIDIDNCLTDESNYLAFDSSSYNGFELMLNQKFGIVSLGIYQYMDTYDSFSNGLNGGN